MLKHTFKIKKNAILYIVIILFVQLILNKEASSVPGNNEFVYLLYLVKQWNPNYLLNDWTFSVPLPGHLVFNFLFGTLTLLFSLEIVGWIGRIFCWFLAIIALFQLGKNFRIPLSLITVSIFMWLLYRQSIVADSWILGTFEAKCIAYILLLFSLHGFINKKETLAPILLGASVSFHPAVGLWGGLAVGLTLIALKYPIKKLFKVVGYTTLFALPGLILIMPMVFGSASGTLEDWKFLALVREPSHLDPFSWRMKDIVLVYMLLLFNWLHFRNDKEDHKLKFLLFFQLSLCLFFSLGLVFRFFENYQLLRFFPFRLFPVFVLLFFFFHLLSAYYHYSSIKLSASTIIIGFLTLLSFSNPFGNLKYLVLSNYLRWTHKEEEVQKAFKWLAKNTPNGSVAILPPWRKDSSYLSQRAQIASWKMPRLDRPREWRERIESMVGDVSDVRGDSKITNEKMEYRYNQLTEIDIESIIKKYGGDYLVSKKDYSYPMLFDSGSYKVYALKKEILPTETNNK